MAKDTDTPELADSQARIGGTPRARFRPHGVSAPAHWQADGGPPAPQAGPYEAQGIKDMPDPVRYGDWERKGIAIDF